MILGNFCNFNLALKNFCYLFTCSRLWEKGNFINYKSKILKFLAIKLTKPDLFKHFQKNYLA